MQTTVQTFPRIQARNLESREFTLPDDFEGRLNVALVAFQRWHQRLVDSWLPWLHDIKAAHPDIHTYELPVISHFYFFMRPIIDGGMAAAIPNQDTREHTLTIYTDVNGVLRGLNLANTSTIAVLLVDRQGNILWRGRGGYDEHQAASLKSALHSEMVV